jgi:serpin B
MALGMTMNGAAGPTYDAMRQTLGFAGIEQQQINDGYKSLISLLRGLDKSTQFELANSIWYRQGFPVLPSFLDATRSAFDAEVSALDFTNAPAALSAVNGWAAQKTKGKIPSILDQIDPSDVMYLLNAIYFKGSWRLRFDAQQTRDAPFHAADGSAQTAKLMHKEDTLRYLETPQFQAADLLYGNGAFAMTVLLPKEGTGIDAFAASLTRADWTGWTEAFHTRKVVFELPRLTFAYERKLNDDLSALGMGVAFDPQRADFSRMAPISTQRLYVSFVKQKAFVDVNEEGTEAAAVTAVGVSVTSAPIIPTMRVDRPFIFVIRERLSGTMLFMGKIAKLPNG